MLEGFFLLICSDLSESKMNALHRSKDSNDNDLKTFFFILIVGGSAIYYQRPLSTLSGRDMLYPSMEIIR